MRLALRRIVIAVVALLVACGAAWALAQEDVGNEPLNEANFSEWPGVVSVVNHPSRVYHLWVNGSEQCFFQGDVAALNDTLRKFAEVRTESRDVLLRPGPGETQTLVGGKTIPFSWHLQLYGGISRHLLGLDGGKQIWSDHPVLSVYTGGIDLNKIEIPKGVTLLSITDVKKRTREGLKSKDKTVRGWGAGMLASLDGYDPESQETVTALLNDPDNWVRLNAVHSLPAFGKRAKTALPHLRELLKSDDPQLKEAAAESIQKIEQAQSVPDQDQARQHREQLEQIERFVAAKRG